MKDFLILIVIAAFAVCVIACAEKTEPAPAPEESEPEPTAEESEPEPRTFEPEMLELDFADFTDGWTYDAEDSPLQTLRFPDIRAQYVHRNSLEVFKYLYNSYLDPRSKDPAFVAQTQDVAVEIGDPGLEGYQKVYAVNLTLTGDYYPEGPSGPKEERTFVVPYMYGQDASNPYIFSALTDNDVYVDFDGTNHAPDEVNRLFCAWLESGGEEIEEEVLRAVFREQVFRKAVGIKDGKLAFFPAAVADRLYYPRYRWGPAWPREITPLAELEPAELDFAYLDSEAIQALEIPEGAFGVLVRLPDHPNPVNRGNDYAMEFEPSAEAFAIARYLVPDVEEWVTSTTYFQDEWGQLPEHVAQYLFIPLNPEADIRLMAGWEEIGGGDNVHYVPNSVHSFGAPCLITAGYDDDGAEQGDLPGFLNLEQRSFPDLLLPLNVPMQDTMPPHPGDRDLAPGLIDETVWVVDYRDFKID